MQQAKDLSEFQDVQCVVNLSLPDDILAFLTTGRLSAGHARALVGHPRASALAQQIVAKQLSVRDAEKLAKKPETGSNIPRSRSGKTKDADTAQLEAELSATLRMKVSIDHAGNSESGKLTINYNNLGQLDDLLRALSGG